LNKTFSKKKTSTLFALIIVASMAVSMFSATNFAAAADLATYPFVEAIPNPVGVNQRTLINLGLINYLALDGDGWNVTLTITDPSGHTQSIDLMTWSTGTVGYSFIPETTGTYILKCSFDRVFYNSSQARVATGWYAASETPPYELVVQTDPVPAHPGHALPSEYWSRTIDSQLREWWSISGSWLQAPNNLYAPYNDAPESAHILWTMPVGDTMGGMIGGETEAAYQNGDAYEGKFAGSIIISGILYYNRYVAGRYSTPPLQEAVAVDLHTGDVLWERVLDGNGRISFGQILNWNCLNNRGGFSYIYVASGTNLYAFEALTGDWLFNFTNVPSGSVFYGPGGELLKYSVQNLGSATNPNYRLLQWNSSWLVIQGRVGMQESWGSAIQNTQWNGTKGYDINVSITNTLPSATVLKAFPGDRVIGGNYTVASNTTNGVTLWSLSLEPGKIGQLIFSKTWIAPSSWSTLAIGMQSNFMTYSQEDYVAIFWAKEARINYAFSLETGELLWETEPQIYADSWTDSPAFERGIAYHKLYSASCGGIVYCFDINTGDTLWTYNASDPYMESYISGNWWLIMTFISDGKVYLGHMEHSAQEPKPRGAPFICLDAETGEEIWRIDGAFRQTRWGGRAIIGDSIIATMDTYDNQIYAIGKGPSKTTVNPMTSAIVEGSSAVISGSVTDVSPGTETDKIAMRFPNGVPAVSDASQSDWMLYVYKQFEQPMDVSGVPVSIDAVDPNGNYIHLADATTDMSGTYSAMVKPAAAGQYTIYVTFAGTSAYYGSYATTCLGVEQGAQSTPATTTQTSMTDQYFLPVAGIIIVIALIGVVLSLLALKRHP
jgi:outer membrane protein assembly factor BamB